jgi:branched-chain amino acid transport system permease protein
MSGDKIGVDRWVEQYSDRVKQDTGLRGLLSDARGRIPAWGWIIILFGLGLLVPLLTSNTFAIRIAGNVALLGTLALGLNVVVGYAGLLDLGFVAFYGIGAYTYAYLSSNFTGIHLPTPITLLIILLVSVLFGLLIGSTSLRLMGDYLAIVTLGFGQVFVQLMTSLTRVSLPGQERPVDLTGGPNGIVQLDPFSLFGFRANSVQSYYVVLLVMLCIMLLIIYHLYHSRVGRAWTALREDELAAEAMGMPTRRLKVQAFMTGAAIAGVSGGLFASWQGSVFPSNFDTTLLITVYAIIVLGGLGSLPGVVLGSILIVAIPDILRNADLAGKLFYAGTFLLLVVALRPRWQTPLLVLAVIIFGLLLRPILTAASPESFVPFEPTGSAFTDTVRGWLAIPAESFRAGNLAFLALLALGLTTTRVKSTILRFILLIPTLYLLIFVWETRLSQEPSVTRLIFVGLLLVVLMIYRPNGLLGQRRVEVV